MFLNESKIQTVKRNGVYFIRFFNDRECQNAFKKDFSNSAPIDIPIQWFELPDDEFLNRVVKLRGTFATVAYKLKFGDEYKNISLAQSRHNMYDVASQRINWLRHASYYDQSTLCPMVVTDKSGNQKTIPGNIRLSQHETSVDRWEDPSKHHSKAAISIIFEQETLHHKQVTKNDNECYIIWQYKCNINNSENLEKLLQRFKTRVPLTKEEADSIMNMTGEVLYGGRGVFLPTDSNFFGTRDVEMDSSKTKNDQPVQQKEFTIPEDIATQALDTPPVEFKGGKFKGLTFIPFRYEGNDYFLEPDSLVAYPKKSNGMPSISNPIKIGGEEENDAQVANIAEGLLVSERKLRKLIKESVLNIIRNLYS